MKARQRWITQVLNLLFYTPPKDYTQWPYSSYRDYTGPQRPWVQPKRILDLFTNRREYADFVSDYEEVAAGINDLKYDLADHAETF